MEACSVRWADCRARTLAYPVASSISPIDTAGRSGHHQVLCPVRHPGRLLLEGPGRPGGEEPLGEGDDDRRLEAGDDRGLAGNP